MFAGVCRKAGAQNPGLRRDRCWQERCNEKAWRNDDTTRHAPTREVANLPVHACTTPHTHTFSSHDVPCVTIGNNCSMGYARSHNRLPVWRLARRRKLIKAMCIRNRRRLLGKHEARLNNKRFSKMENLAHRAHKPRGHKRGGHEATIPTMQCGQGRHHHPTRYATDVWRGMLDIPHPPALLRRAATAAHSRVRTRRCDNVRVSTESLPQPECARRTLAPPCWGAKAWARLTGCMRQVAAAPPARK